MEGYDVNIARLIAKEIWDKEVQTETNILFSLLVTQLCLEVGVLILSEVYNFRVFFCTTNMG